MTRLAPICPGILIPLKTRAGKALAPIEPGARTLCDPWLTGPRLKLWRLIPPWKPLPIEIPETFTVWPASNASTVTSSPILGPSSSLPRSSSRNSARWRIGAAPAFFRWPSSALVSTPRSTSPKASCTAA